MNGTIGILYICTGKYDVFWKDFYLSCENYFCNDMPKRYYVFTDAPLIYDQQKKNICKIEQGSLGRPDNTLMRFDMFCRIKDQLIKETDYLFFFNANAQFLQPVTSDILPKSGNYLLGVEHPCFMGFSADQYTYDRNPESLAYIPYGQGEDYLIGGFNGGRTPEYLHLMETCNENIKKDKEKGIIALWHDESHLNRYFLGNLPAVILDCGYACPEDYPDLPIKKRMVLMRDKTRYGGHQFLRGESDQKLKPEPKEEPKQSKIIKLVEKVKHLFR